MAQAVHVRPHHEDSASVGLLSAAVLVSALGYFVDLYDLVVFSVVRVASLAELGVAGDAALSTGVLLLDLQSVGLLVGGILWGVLADRRGRVRVLFASIALYSVANMANAFVTSVPQYAALRFIAGVGLAGELGVAVTLVSESLPRAARTYGPMLVIAIGVMGALAAALTGGLLPWRVAYLLGGALGLALLALRLRLSESGLFADARGAQRGDLRLLVSSRRRLGTLARLVLVGVPNWFVAGILVAFSPEIARELGATGAVTAAQAVVASYLGYGAGTLLWGYVSQRARTRWWVCVGGVIGLAASMFACLLVRGMPPLYYYATMFAAAASVSHLTIVLSMTTELFGTNLRATATTSVPNFVRASVIPMTLAFALLGTTPALGLVIGALLVGTAVALVALAALRGLPETWGRDLDFIET
ncbi:MAG TPA: MFS transporter [Candidatus Thermoplasmatota archaeon]|nr:MFS transporter [Candidatus Thermoplasmatota archaeon]